MKQNFKLMCGRVFVKSNGDVLLAKFSFAKRRQGDELDGFQPRYNGAPGLEYPIIVREPDYPGGVLTSAKVGSDPRMDQREDERRPPINARAEAITAKPMFRDAYRSRRALMPIDGFFEWKAIKGPGPKQPHAITMRDGEPFCVAAIWAERQVPFELGRVTERTFAVMTCAANELVGLIHDRMPVIIAPEDYQRWISEESDPRDLLRPYPAELMIMWSISTRVNSTRNDDPEILEPVEESD